MLENTR